MKAAKQLSAAVSAKEPAALAGLLRLIDRSRASVELHVPGKGPLLLAALQSPWACCEPQLIQRLLRIAPAVRQQRTDGGWSMLHVAARTAGVSDRMQAKTVALLLRDRSGDDPAAAVTDRGWLPLHVAAQSAGPRVLRVLLNAYAYAAAEASDAGWLPLHVALRARRDLEVLELLLRAYPDAARTCCGLGGWTTLHVAAHFGAPADFCSALLEVAAEKASAVDSSGALPLHLALNSGGCALPAVVQALLDAAPQATAARLCGWLPIHIALRCARGEALASILLSFVEVDGKLGSNSAAEEVEQLRMLPLHLAARHGAGLRVLNILLGACAHAVLAEDALGNLPLHYAVLYEHDADVYAALVDADLTALAVKNVHGFTPVNIDGCTPAARRFFEELLRARGEELGDRLIPPKPIAGAAAMPHLLAHDGDEEEAAGREAVARAGEGEEKEEDEEEDEEADVDVSVSTITIRASESAADGAVADDSAAAGPPAALLSPTSPTPSSPPSGTDVSTLAASPPLAAAAASPPRVAVDLDRARAQLEKGVRCRRHLPRAGKVHKCSIWLAGEPAMLFCWKRRMEEPKNDGILLSDIVAVRAGLVDAHMDGTDERLAFSVHTAKKTLALEALREVECAILVSALSQMVSK